PAIAPSCPWSSGGMVGMRARTRTGAGHMGRVDGKVIVITGAAGGQGAAEANALTAEGATVVATDVKDPIEELAPGVEFHLHDVASEESWAELAGKVREAHGTVHGLINNAGITWRERLMD